MANLTDKKGKPSSGQILTPQVGLVVDNVDPDEMGRIKVKFPAKPGEPESTWVRLCTQNGGKERGLYSMPEKDDEVICLFMSGSQEEPLIIGQMWNGKDKPPTEAKDGMPGAGETDTGGEWSTAKFNDGSSGIDDNDRRLWRSRSGHIICLDDTDGKETIQIWDQSHKLCIALDSKDGNIFITNNNNDIHIRTKNDLYFEAGNDVKLMAGNNIEVECKNDTNWKAGNNIKSEASSNSEHEAGSNYKIKGTSAFEAKGGTAKVEGDSSADFKGGSTATLKGGASVTISASSVSIN